MEDTHLFVADVSKTYPGNVEALKNVSLTISRGRILCLLGPNGAGKSTLVKCIVGLLTPDTGSVRLSGRDIVRDEAYARERIGVVFEEVNNIYGYLSVRENIRYYAHLNGMARTAIPGFLELWLEKMQLTDKAATPGFKLSRGMKQKVAFIIALLKSPELLILDEPTLGLDVRARRDVIDLIKELGTNDETTILLTTHDMALAEEVADLYCFIHRGKALWQGNSPQLTEEFGKDARLESIFTQIMNWGEADAFDASS